MPVWAVTLLVRFVLPLLIQWAVRHNLIGELTGSLAKFGLSIEAAQKYPTGKNGQQEENTIPTPNNLTVTQPPS